MIDKEINLLISMKLVISIYDKNTINSFYLLKLVLNWKFKCNLFQFKNNLTVCIIKFNVECVYISVAFLYTYEKLSKLFTIIQK